MENISSGFGGEEEEEEEEEQQQQVDLPAGFRFHPTDEELITYYLFPKVLNTNFSAIAIGEVDLNKCEPWDLPKRAKMGEKEWYFFCVRDRKYPTGLRTNRATEAGYWKATGKDKEIYKDKSLVGMKKTLVFYKGRAPKGEKSNWVMHEYRLEGKNSPQNLPPSAKNEWVISRVFEKNSSGKRIPYQGLMRPESGEFRPSGLPPLMDSSPTLPNVPCFSNSANDQNPIPTNPYSSQGQGYYSQYHPRNQGPNPVYAPQMNQFPYESDMLRSILGGAGEKQGMVMKTEVSLSQDGCLSSEMNAAEISSVVSNYEMGRAPFDDYHEGPSASGGPVDIESFLDYRSNTYY